MYIFHIYTLYSDHFFAGEILLNQTKLPTRKDITELRNFGSPPSLVLMVMELVALLFGCPTDWVNAKTLISENNFGKRFRNFEKEPESRVSAEVFRDLRIGKWVSVFSSCFRVFFCWLSSVL